MIKGQSGARFGKPKLKREDFICENGWFDSLLRLPQTLHMQQFQISDCEECDIFLLDANAGVYIDDCKYCRIFVGPSESSIFVRNCHSLTVICCTKQFRVRDSTECTFMLWCHSQPIIESSHHLNFACFPNLAYRDLSRQFNVAKLGTIWDNNWFDIYDFTPTKFGRDPNHQCIKSEALLKMKQSSFIKTVADQIQTQQLKLQYDLFPMCLSTLSIPPASYIIAVVQPIPESAMGLKTFHSRVAAWPVELASMGLQGLCLFGKIKREWLGEWREKCGVVRAFEQGDDKQVIESRVFVAFGDER